MKAILLSSLVKVFKDEEPNFSEFSSFSALKNEKFSFQLSLMAENDSETDISVSLDSPIKDDISVFLVRNMPTEKTGYDNSDNFHYDLKRTEFPDLLEPVDGKISLPVGEYHSIWFTYKPHNAAAGVYPINITVSAGSATIKKTFTLTVIDAELPEQELLFTNWFHNDCLCTYYGVEVFSDEYWRIAENYIKNAVEHGVTMLLTPIFTPPLDTEVGGERPTVQLVGVKKDKGVYSFDFENFEKYVALCLKCGIKAFEISHFFTQWGAEHAPKIIATVDGEEKRIFGWETEAAGDEYKGFLTSFAPAFREETEKLGIKDICWVHVSDEPNDKQLEIYKKAADIVKELFYDFNSLDALSDIEYFRNGLIKTPVCGEDEADIFRPEVENFWTYYCCTQVHNHLPNRFFSMPSSRNRILGTLLYKYDAQGFLHWGHNFWYTQYSKKAINPYEITDAGNAFPSGDSFVVYPGEGGKPLNSLRHLVFNDGFQDMRALRLLESLTSREYVLKFIEKDLFVPLTFRTYPHEESWLLGLRQRINEEIAKNI